jgi:hypothetical protein
LFDALVQLLKAAVLVGLLVLAWTMPAAAHPRHGASYKPTVQTASSSEHVLRQMSAAACLSSDDATVCAATRRGMAAPLDDSQPGGGSAHVCCGTMCTVAAIELSATSLLVRTSHRFRRFLPPDRLQLTRTPGLPARPPRTSDIA